MTSVNAGSIFVVTFTITDSDGAAYDPASVVWHYTDHQRVKYTKIYGTDDEATKVSTGVYQLEISIPYAFASVGRWDYDVQGLDGSNNSLITAIGGFDVIYNQVLYIT